MVPSSSFPSNIIVRHGQLTLHCISNRPGLWAEEHSSILNPNALPSLQVLLVSLSWQHLFSKVPSASGGRAALSDSTWEVTADHSQRPTIQYHERFDEEKGQGKGLVTQRLGKYLLQQLSTFAKTESKYEWSQFEGRRLFRDRMYWAKTTWIPAIVLQWRKKKN